MANSRKDSPDRVKRMRELYANGASAREIGSALGVSHKTVIRWLESHGGKKPEPGGLKALARAELAKPAAAAASELLEDVGTEAPLEVLRRRRQQIRMAIEENFDATTTGAFPMTIFERLAKLEVYYLAEEARHTPPEPPDPDKDPHNIDANRRMAAMLGALIDQAETDTKCAHCGKHPFNV